jgi:hypothetical protein
VTAESWKLNTRTLFDLEGIAKAPEVIGMMGTVAEEPVKPVDGPASARMIRKATKAAEKVTEKVAPAVYDPTNYPDGAARADAFLAANPPAQEKPAPAADKPKRARKAKPAPIPEPTGPVLSGETVRVKIATAAWSMLSRERRADLTLPMDGIALRWEEGDGFVCADVPAEAVNALRGMGEARGVEVKTVETAEMKEGEAA